MPSLSIVIPAYNECSTIEDIVKRSLVAARKVSNDVEVVVLDDASKDNTVEIVEHLVATEPHVRLLKHEKNQGIAKTFEDLYAAAQKEYVFLVSGDGQFPPELVERAMPLLAQADIVICRRTYKHYSPYRHVISILYRWMPCVLFGIDLLDPGSVKLVPKKLYTEIRVRSKSVFVEAERIIRAVKGGATIASVDFRQEPRKGGRAGGARWQMVLASVRDMLSLWWDLLLHPFTQRYTNKR